MASQDRTIHRVKYDGAKVLVVFKPTLDEYECRYFWRNIEYTEANYFTDDKQDAINTAGMMVRDNLPSTVPDSER